MSIRAITFDWWNTLFRDAHNPPRQTLRIDVFVHYTGADPEIVAAVLKTVWAEFERSHRQDQRTLYAMDAVHMTADALQIQLQPEQAQKIAEGFATAVVQQPPVPIEGAREAVLTARKQFPVGIISDTGVSPGTSLRTIMDKHDFTNLFDAMTFSDEIGGMAKPRPLPFERTAQLLGVKPHELLHIGDLPYTDVAGAKGVNAKAGLFTGVTACPTDGFPPSDYTFASWQEFIDLLPELS